METLAALSETEARALKAPTIPPADRHPALVYLSTLAPGSRRTMRGALDTMAGILTGGALDAETMSWGALRYQHSQALRTRLAERYAPSTANKTLAALKGVLKECWRLGYVDAETYRRAADLQTVKGSRLPAGRLLLSGEVRALFEVCAQETPTAGARDAALLAVLVGAGLRRAEVVALDLEDYDVETGELRIRNGKGRKDRVSYATNGALDALAAWLEVRGSEPGPLFVPIAKGGKATLRRMTTQAVFNRLRYLAQRAKVAELSPHDFRRSFISNLLDSGADLATVQALAGHSSPTTTARYDRRGERAKKRAAEMLHVPFRR